jgi:hypothetical protein
MMQIAAALTHGDWSDTNTNPQNQFDRNTFGLSSTADKAINVESNTRVRYVMQGARRA